MVNSFANISVLDELDGENLHRLSNGLTLEVDLHILFDTLKLWFEEVQNQPYTYDVHTLRLHGFLPQPRRVTFKSTDPALELPNSKYLKLHAAVCRVAHMSGAAKYLDLHDREVEMREVMAHDGSSAELLDSRLHRVVLTV
ncbi:unnamed protein product [Cyclocybe aegerita]|uniref:HNH nuclease domain-containing protein n=1 Tax=Cyclocybe aegerita TaxID=1973307 RepID=A0A8S0X197_CYCAE|nr:unnamed protein product [Cyclocybe aegerita]